MNLAQLQYIAPSVFTVDNSHHKTSDKYKQIPTIKIVEQLAEKGFHVTKAMQTNSRIKGNRQFAKHMLRFRHESTEPKLNDGLFPELVLVNSHDGLSSYKLMAGLFRLVCSNGLVVGNTCDEVRVRHQGDIVGQVIEGTYSVVDTATKMLTNADTMSNIQLNQDERMLLATTALELKTKDDEIVDNDNARQFLRARNMYDSKRTDLFTTFNILQENMIKGKVQVYSRDSKGRRIVTRTREVKSIDTNIKLNKALWTMAQKFAELKTK
jgi:hypothetical protein